MKAFKIRNIDIDPPLILSPMAGVTDYVFRRLIKRRGGVGLVVSEFISVEGLTRNNPKSKRQMRFDEEERPFAVQIFGGYGYTKDFPVEKHYRDAKLCTIGEGTSEIQKLVISREVLK